MSSEFEWQRKRGETGIQPPTYLAPHTSGTSAAPLEDIRSWMIQGALSVGQEHIYGIGKLPSITGYHIGKSDFSDFRDEITTDLETIFDRLSELEKKFESFSPVPKVVVIEEISKEEAKKRISVCLNETNEKVYPSEIAERLHIDYDLCVEIIEEFLKKGKIQIAEE
jgi:hypothetical protein